MRRLMLLTALTLWMAPVAGEAAQQLSGTEVPARSTQMSDADRASSSTVMHAPVPSVETASAQQVRPPAVEHDELPLVRREARRAAHLAECRSTRFQ